MTFGMRFALLFPLLLLRADASFLQEATPPAATSAASAFDRAQLEQMAAPVALYEDALIPQILMAATYPLEIVQAQRWIAQNPGLAGQALEEALKTRTWDPSVKSLCGLPTVLQMMSDNLDWTQDLGDAFLGQRAELMEAIQDLRAKALEAGTLKSVDEVKVRREGEIIIVESSRPDVVYVPTYYPIAVYGPRWHYATWYYPSFFHPHPPGAVFIGFGFGFVWGHNLWGFCDWHHHVVHVHVHHFNDFCKRTESVPSSKILPPAAGNRVPWRHDPAHRKGVEYRSAGVAQEFGAATGARRITREQARGFERSGAPARAQPSEPIPREQLRTPPARTPGARPVPPVNERVTPVPRPGTPPEPRVRPTPRPGVPPRAAPEQAEPFRRRGVEPVRPAPTRPRAGPMGGIRNPTLDRAARDRGAASRGTRPGPRPPR